MPELIATRRLSYGTRRLQAAEPFTASKQDARVLVALGRATYRTTQAAPLVVKEPEASAPVVLDEQPAAPVVQAQPAKPGRKKAK
ncbi:MAG: hypothetical protein JSS56_04715 [Proteobacteria bacterium]|nr:hypothetical protein [Pseudomonadota bacterium]